MKINHHPIFDTEVIIKHYSEKDGVEVQYICTSAPNEYADYAADIFYRETPHPEFGNRYFGLYKQRDYNSKLKIMIANTIMIFNADNIENLEFGMVEGPDGWEYSQHRHDYRQVGNVAIDGGRSYSRRVGDLSTPFKIMKVENGVFVERKEDEIEI